MGSWNIRQHLTSSKGGVCIGEGGRLRLGSAVAVISLALALTGCAGPTQSQAEPSTEVVASAGPAAPPASNFAATNDPASSAEPTVDGSQARAAAEKFAVSYLSVGYPTETRAEYLNHVKPLMTRTAYASQQGASPQRDSLSERTEQLSKHLIRVVPRLTSVKVTAVGDNKAVVKITAELTRQQRQGKSWKSRGQIQQVYLTTALEAQQGIWLVESVS